jgi:ABC-2 type transport system ATP-binding protein
MIKIRNLKYIEKKSGFSVECMNLNAESGKRLGIYGGSASGKTLFTQILSGIIKNYSGSIEIGITELRNTYRKKIGYVPFDNILYRELTVKEMSLLLLDQYKVPEPELKIKSEWFSNYFDMSDMWSKKICRQ